MDDKEMQKIAKTFGKKADKYIVAIAIAQYIIKNDATIRATAEKFKIGKSTVTNRLELLKDAKGYKTLYKNARKVIESHKKK